MRLLVCGGRGYSDRTTVYEAINALVIERGPVEILIHGGASGADTLAEEWAVAHGVDFIRCPANWSNILAPNAVIRYSKNSNRAYNAAAGPLRNHRMIDDHAPDLVLAFKGGDGTKNMIDLARKAGIEVVEVE